MDIHRQREREGGGGNKNTRRYGHRVVVGMGVVEESVMFALDHNTIQTRGWW